MMIIIAALYSLLEMKKDDLIDAILASQMENQ
jgi:hypothetical protein